jgi:hypothetical protein
LRQARFRTFVLVLTLGAAAAFAGCGGGGEQRMPDAGMDVARDTAAGDGGASDGVDAPASDAPIDRPGDAGMEAPGKPIGSSCTTAGECSSGFCADGVCCNSACTGVCVTCAGQGTVGTCISAQIGTDPRDECPVAAASTCGSTGMCDGTGACDKYPAGTVCQEMGCTGSTLTSAFRCDGAGACVQTAGQSCAPFNCATDGRCLTICTGDADCVAPNSCINGSCGKKPIGAACGGGPECNSGFCEQGVCCGAACTGTCRSCNVPGSVGTCTNVPDGSDPLGQCADQGATTCGSDGACDGKAACRLYASGTQCIPPACTGGTATLPGRCDGMGMCARGTQQPCEPYACGTSGACRTACTTSADCSGGNVCNGTICGKKVNGADCAAGTECASGSCQQGVCCAGACTGICMSCALAASRGVCTAIPASTDPLNQCADSGANSCGTDGSCNGAGACRLYAPGLSCGAQMCTGSTQMLAGRCDGAGTCMPGATQPCAPYLCSGTSCLASCTTSAECTTGNVCTASSCGLKPLGAACAAGTECNSGFCAQGVCCRTACTGTCMSCALTGTGGTCSTVPAGQDPLNQCADQGAAGCGTDGTCDGSGGCRRYLNGTSCAAATCSMGSYTPERTCNGAGVCQTTTPISCGAYACNTNATCRTSCTGDADCTAPNICNAGQCTKKPLGTPCTGATECASGLCQQGVCCSSSCTGTCRSCALAGSAGTCTMVPVGQDPLSQCADNGATTCGTDGACDGAGACRLYAAGTVCVAAACTGSTYSPARTCNGTGTCQTTSPSTCAPYQCGTNAACRTTCATSSDCTSPNTCLSGSCGKKPVGASCTAAAECNSDFCEQGVCCATACVGICRSCALTGTVGTCASVAAGLDPFNQCTDQGASTCGNDGTCDGSGACRRYANGTTCAPSTCAGTTFTPARTCDGAGVCGTVTAGSCGAYNCGPSGTCLATCTADADCVAPNVCNGGSCGKRPNGAACTAAAECASGFCEQGACCLTACAGSCRSCGMAGTAGTCTLVAAGADPLGQCADSGASTCGSDGACDGGGACRQYASGTICVAASCAGTTFTPARTCNGTGTCQTTTASSCGNYACATDVCRTSCTVDADCAAPNVCVMGACTKRPSGMSCAAGGDCLTGLCAQGVCCATVCDGVCESCALAGSLGTCTDVPTGQDPLGQCSDQGANSCGTDGFCDGAGGCRRYASGTQCGTASCTGSTLTSSRSCNGTGTCQAATSSMCDPYACGTGACRTTCTLDSHCVSPNTCIGGSCTKKAIGAACGAGGECLSGFCAQGVCCNSACGGCQSCALTGAIGACTNVPDGQDPLNNCADLGTSSCSNDGMCNGSGACRLYAAGTQCVAPACSGTTFTPARTCNGTGTCQTATPSSCAPYACGSGACRTTCATTADCASPNTCSGTSCGLLPLGATCTAPAQCNSGFCEQGVCCGGACTGTCRSCAVAGNLGACTNVPSGQDPLNQCPDAGAGTCGNDGTCNGAGACRLYAAGTQCAAPTCTGATLTSARACNGTGTCLAATTSSCSPYQCGTGACRASCTVDGDCVSPNICASGGVCTKRPNGATCAADGDCTSNICAQNVCCASTCTASCRSCALAGTLGTCTNVPAGQDPLNHCTDAGAGTCGNDGTCNGAGACRLYITGTQCAASACSGSTLTPARTCNGTGTCQTVSNSNCNPYACNTNGTCRTSCTTTADCNAPNVCLGTTCAPNPNLKVQYFRAEANATDQAVKPHFKVFNTGTIAVTLSSLTIRYWYTIDTPVDAESSHCDYATLGCNNITTSNVTLSPTRTNADRYFQVGFAAGAGNLTGGTNTGEIQVRFNKNSWGNYNEVGDYSYDATKTAYADWNRVTLYQNGTLVWGTEP